MEWLAENCGVSIYCVVNYAVQFVEDKRYTALISTNAYIIDGSYNLSSRKFQTILFNSFALCFQSRNPILYCLNDRTLHSLLFRSAFQLAKKRNEDSFSVVEILK